MTDTLHGHGTPPTPEDPSQHMDELEAILRSGKSPEEIAAELRSRGIITEKDLDPASPSQHSQAEYPKDSDMNSSAALRAENNGLPALDSDPLTPEHRGWSLKTKVIAALSALAVAAATVIGGSIVYARSSAAARPPAATAPATTGPSPTPDVVSPTSSSVETTPAAPKLPFDPERVAIMKGETAAEFFENNGPNPRIQYVLSEYHGEVHDRSVYGHKLTQELPNGYGRLSDYNLFKEISLTAESDPQDVLYAHLYGWLFAILHEDPEEGKKMLAIVVDDPNSAAYRDLAVQAEKLAGFDKSLIKTILSDNYQELKSQTRRKVVDGKTQLNIITQGGAKFEFVFKPIEGLAETNQNDDDDGKEVGSWPVKSFGQAQVTFK